MTAISVIQNPLEYLTLHFKIKKNNNYTQEIVPKEILSKYMPLSRSSTAKSF